MSKKLVLSATRAIRKKFIYDPIDYVFGKAGYEVRRQKTPPPKPSATTIEEFAEANNLIVDRISNSNETLRELVSFLQSHGCFVQTILSERNKTLDIIFKHKDINYIVNTIGQFHHRGIEVLFIQDPKKAGHKKKTQFFLRCGGKIYAQYELSLDPWVENEDRVYSHSPNAFMSSVSSFYINRTVSALHPYSLQGKPGGDISLGSMLGVTESLNCNFDFPVDAVYTWVDGSDERWLASKSARHGKPLPMNDDVAHTRFRSIDEIRYSLRSVLSFAPFIRTIYIITDNQRPHWISEHHPMIKFVDHKDIFQTPASLPTFNSHAIEANIHRVEGLAEHFLYLNDDLMFWNKCFPNDFFHANGLTKSFLEHLPNVYGPMLPSTPAWRAGALNSNELIKRRYGKTLNAHHLHTPFALRRSIMNAMWEEFPEALQKVTDTPFRSAQDVSPVSFLYHAYSFCEGQSTFDTIHERRMSLASATFSRDIEAATKSRTIKVACLNDGESEYYEENKKAFYTFMQKKFPVPAPWELDR